MKTGVILVAAAVALFFATMLWSVRQPVQWQGKDGQVIPALQVSRASSTSLFYDIGQFVSCSVHIPVHVMLDESFSGVEITGDTSFSKKVKVHLPFFGHGENTSKKLIIAFDEVHTSGAINYEGYSEDFPKLIRQFDSIDITVRIGLQPDPAKNTDRNLDFRYAKSVNSVTAISAKKLNLSAGRGTADLMLDTRNLSMMAENTFVKLKGHANRACFYTVNKARLDAKELITKEVYYQGSEGSYLDVFASDIVHGYYSPTATINISGNPPYQRID